MIVAYQDGFVLAGRSLREVEARESQLTTFVGGAWILTLLATLFVLALDNFFLKDKA